MSQSNLIVATVFVAFLVYVTVKGQLNSYLSVFV